MSRIRTCTSASSISSCGFVQRLEKTCMLHTAADCTLLQNGSCLKCCCLCIELFDVSKNKEKCWCGGPLIITSTVLV